jgi:hypothetical protein
VREVATLAPVAIRSAPIEPATANENGKGVFRDGRFGRECFDEQGRSTFVAYRYGKEGCADTRDRS